MIVEENVFDKMGKYWEEMADQNSTDCQLEFIKNTLNSEELILDLACGTGRHLIPLSKEGYKMVGLDVSSNLLRIAKKRGGDIQLINADMRFLPFTSKAFSSVVSMDTSFGYLPTEKGDLQCLTAVRESLMDGGMLIVDVFNRDHLISKNKTNWIRQLKWALLPLIVKAAWMPFHFFKWKEYPSFFLLQKRSVDAKDSKLHDLWVVCGKEDQQIRVFEHNTRLYGVKQMQVLLEKAGFTVKAIYGDYGKQKLDSTSNRLIFVAKSE